MNIISDNKNKNKEIINLLLIELYKNYPNLIIYVDNVKTQIHFEIINDFIKNYDSKIYILIQINKNTFNILSKIKYLFIYSFNINKPIFSDDMEYRLLYSQNILKLDEIKKIYSNKLKNFFNNVDYEVYLYLL